MQLVMELTNQQQAIQVKRKVRERVRVRIRGHSPVFTTVLSKCHITHLVSENV